MTISPSIALLTYDYGTTSPATRMCMLVSSLSGITPRSNQDTRSTTANLRSDCFALCRRFLSHGIDSCGRPRPLDMKAIGYANAHAWSSSEHTMTVYTTGYPETILQTLGTLAFTNARVHIGTIGDETNEMREGQIRCSAEYARKN